jgi:MFS family permease
MPDMAIDSPIEPIAPVFAPAQASSEPWPSPRVAWYAVFVFALTLMINFLDRGILPLLVPSIKADLQLSDSQMGVVMGFAFVMFYVILGLPVARLADVGTRRTIVGIGIALWSGMTALCGLAQNFWQLFLFRVGTGVGESCNGPATYSMLSDLFPPAKLPRAIAVMSFGFMGGTGLALIVGGAIIHFLAAVPPVSLPLIGTLKSWQMAFLLVGVPGLLVSALVFTIREPVRRGRMTKDGKHTSIPLRDVVKFVYDNRRIYGPMLLGLAFSTTLSIGNLSWAPAFYGRTYGWRMDKVGLISGFVFLVVWPLGAMLGSHLAERWHKQGHDDANLRVTVWSLGLYVPLAVIMPLMPSAELAIGVNAVAGFVAAMLLGPQNAALQVVTPNEMRGQITALLLFTINVLGYGVGPSFVAALTDYVFGSEAMLRYAMSTAAAVLGPLAVITIWSGLKPYARAVAGLQHSWGDK